MAWVIKLCLGVVLAITAVPASAQIFWSPPDFSGLPMTTLEPGIGVPLPGATAEEQRAALLWNMRSALNLAALQCGFEPMLRTEKNYNAMLNDHREELAVAYGRINGYFKRKNSTPALAQKALDSYGTKTISSFSTVRGQLGFCQTAGNIGRQALFTPRGSLGTLATERLRELYNSQVYAPDKQFWTRPIPRPVLPRFDASCWDKRDAYKTSCGVQK
jgi:hypothetical protein